MTIIKKLSEPDLVFLLTAVMISVLVIAWLTIRSVRDVKVAKYSYQAQMHSAPAQPEAEQLPDQRS